MLFYCPCLRCGSDLISDEHKIGKVADGADIFSGYYCKKVGRPPTYHFERLKEGYTKFIEATDKLREDLGKAGYPMPDPTRLEKEKVTIAGVTAVTNNDRDQRR